MNAPITFAYRNLVFGRDLDDAWALYRLAMTSYDGLSVAAKKDLLGQIAAFAYSVEADFQLLRVSRGWSVHEYVDAARAALDPRHGHQDEHERLLADHQQVLGQRNVRQPEAYLAVRLSAPSMGRDVGNVLATLRQGLRRLADGTGVHRDARGVSKRQLDALAQRQEQVFGRIIDFLDAEPTSTSDVEWLIRRSYCRGLGEPDCEPAFEPQALVFPDEADEWRYVPLEHDLLRLTNSPVEIAADRLTIHGERGMSHQVAVCLGALPETARFPGRQAELLFAPLEALDFPVDACLSASFVPNDQAVPLIRRRIIDADNAYTEESHGDHGPSSVSAERPRAARELEEYLTTGARPPLLRVSISLALGADSSHAIDERLERLRREYGVVKLHRPAGDQLALFHSHLPAQSSAIADYDDYITVEQLGAMVPVATHAVGSATGHYIGHTLSGSRQPVLFRLDEGFRTNKPPGVLLAGTSGAGKTVLLELLEYLAILTGSRVVDFDPKQERDHRLAELPELDGCFEKIEFSSDEIYRGMIDPLRIALPEVREGLAVSFLLEILPPNLPVEWRREIMAGVRAVVRDAEERARPASCGQVIEHLLRAPNDIAKEVGRTLEVFADSGITRLGFGDPSSPTPEIGHRQVTTLGIRGLVLPEQATPKANFTEEERVGQALVRLLAALAFRLLLQDPTRHALGLFDEAHFLGGDAASRRLIQFLLRMARSLNVTPVLASQTLSDLVEEFANVIGAFFGFSFKEGAEEEAQLAARLTGRSDNDKELAARMMGFSEGRAVFRDYDGRVAEVQIDPGDRLLGLRHSAAPGPDRDA